MLLYAIQSAFGMATPAYRCAANTLVTYAHRVRGRDMLQGAALYQPQALSAHSSFT